MCERRSGRRNGRCRVFQVSERMLVRAAQGAGGGRSGRRRPRALRFACRRGVPPHRKGEALGRVLRGLERWADEWVERRRARRGAHEPGRPHLPGDDAKGKLPPAGAGGRARRAAAGASRARQADRRPGLAATERHLRRARPVRPPPRGRRSQLACCSTRRWRRRPGALLVRADLRALPAAPGSLAAAFSSIARCSWAGGGAALRW